MRYILTFLGGFLLSGMWFGCHIFIRQQIAKKRLDRLYMFSPLLSALIPTVIIFIVAKTHPIHLNAVTNYKLWLIALLTVFITCLIKKLLSRTKLNTKTNRPIFPACVEAAFMELPQRAMLQTFLCWFLLYTGLNPIEGVFINACIWGLDIIVQAYIFRQHDFYEVFIDVFASFVFSIGIGYVYYASGFIVMSMFAHALERYIVTNVKCRRK